MNFCADCPNDGRCFDRCHRLRKAEASHYLKPIALVDGLARGQVRCGPCGTIYPMGHRHGDCKITHPEDSK